MTKAKIIILSFFFAIAISKLNAQTVYVTESGKKYHGKNCSLVKTGKKGIELKEAIKEGYLPCKLCKAEDLKAIEEKGVKIKSKS